MMGNSHHLVFANNILFLIPKKNLEVSIIRKLMIENHVFYRCTMYNDKNMNNIVQCSLKLN